MKWFLLICVVWVVLCFWIVISAVAAVSPAPVSSAPAFIPSSPAGTRVCAERLEIGRDLVVNGTLVNVLLMDGQAVIVTKDCQPRPFQW